MSGSRLKCRLEVLCVSLNQGVAESVPSNLPWTIEDYHYAVIICIQIVYESVEWT